MDSTMAMQSYFAFDLTMNFPTQQDDFSRDRYSTTCPPTIHHPYSSIEPPLSFRHPVWIGDSLVACPHPTCYESTRPLQSQTSPPAQVASFWTGETLAKDHVQNTPAFILSPPPEYHEFDPSRLGAVIPTRHSRGQSFTSVSSYDSYSSNTAGRSDASESSFCRSPSPGSADLSAYGYLNHHGTWSCAYQGCTSRAVFTRGCDLRKHYKRHSKSFFCRHPGCVQATGGGFSSKKDLARHEAKHNPGIVCEWHDCDRIFSRVDNMRDHCRRIHLKVARRSLADLPRRLSR